MHIKSVGRILLGSLFIVTGTKSVLYGFNGFQNTVKSTGIPCAFIMTIFILALKVVGGLIVAFDQNEERIKLAASSLVAFTVLATIMFHKGWSDEKQFLPMMRNISIIGGLILLL